MSKPFGHCKVHLIGRTTDEPEIKLFNEKTLVKVTIAWNSYNGAVNYLKCTFWGSVGENFMKFSPTKGIVVCLEGELQINKYEDRDGNQRYEPSLNVREFTWIPQRDRVKEANNEIPF